MRWVRQSVAAEEMNAVAFGVREGMAARGKSWGEIKVDNGGLVGTDENIWGTGVWIESDDLICAVGGREVRIREGECTLL